MGRGHYGAAKPEINGDVAAFRRDRAATREHLHRVDMIDVFRSLQHDRNPPLHRAVLGQ
jgi:hypothetical protein